MAKDDRRKKFGEVFTPPALVSEILDALPQEAFADPTRNFLDPACGDGNFLVEILRRLMKHMPPLAAVSKLYGIEIQPRHVIACRRRLLEEAGLENNPLAVRVVECNIRCDDTLTAPLQDAAYWRKPQPLERNEEQ